MLLDKIINAGKHAIVLGNKLDFLTTCLSLSIELTESKWLLTVDSLESRTGK